MIAPTPMTRTAVHRASISRTPILSALALLGLVFCLAPAALAQDARPRQPTMTLSGVGEVRTAPDTATVSSGVISEADTAREALDANNAAMRGVLEAIDKAGIDKKDVGTSGFSVRPRYVDPPRPRANEAPQAPRIAGYTVTNQVHVTVRDLARLGAVLDAMVSAGANRMAGINFFIADDQALLDEAREKAVKDARRKAELYAGAAGVELGRILSIDEVRAYVPRARAMPEMAMAVRSDAVPVEAGENELSISVQVTWELVQ